MSSPIARSTFRSASACVSPSVMKPVWRDGEFEPRLMLPFTLSYDHRVIDEREDEKGGSSPRRAAEPGEEGLAFLRQF